MYNIYTNSSCGKQTDISYFAYVIFEERERERNNHINKNLRNTVCPKFDAYYLGFGNGKR